MALLMTQAARPPGLTAPSTCLTAPWTGHRPPLPHQRAQTQTQPGRSLWTELPPPQRPHGGLARPEPLGAPDSRQCCLSSRDSVCLQHKHRRKEEAANFCTINSWALRRSQRMAVCLEPP